MDNRTNSCHVVDFPPERCSLAAFQDLKAGRHSMYALLEVDVTVARQFIEDHKAKTGEAPAARFTRKLVELIKSGYGLEEGQT